MFGGVTSTCEELLKLGVFLGFIAEVAGTFFHVNVKCFVSQTLATLHLGNADMKVIKDVFFHFRSVLVVSRGPLLGSFGSCSGSDNLFSLADHLNPLSDNFSSLGDSLCDLVSDLLFFIA